MQLAFAGRLGDCLPGGAPSLLELARELGVSRLEVADDADLDAAQVREIERSLDAAGIRVLSMHVPCGLTLTPRGLHEARVTMDRARLLGAEMVTFVNQPPPPGSSVEDARRSFANAVALLTTEAELRGLRPTFSNPGGLARYYGQARFLKELCEEHAGRAMMTFDVANWLLAGESVHEALDLLEPWIVVVHLKDWTIACKRGSALAAAYGGVGRAARLIRSSPFKGAAGSVLRATGIRDRLFTTVRGMDGTWYSGAVIGAGVLDHRDILAHLRRLAFTGSLVIEYEGPGNRAEAFRRGTAAVRQVLQDIDVPARAPGTEP